jgi:putative ABC transport system permease protein
MRVILQDLHYALRLFARSPGFTAVAVVTLALGIGANTAIFTVVNAILIERLPYREPARLVAVGEETVRRPGTMNSIGPFNLVRWKERTTTLQDIAAYFDGTTTLVGDGAPEELVVRMVTPNFFDLLGAGPIAGRTFAADEGSEELSDVAMISHGVWQRRFGGDASVVGQSIRLNGRPVEVIGVMPDSFSFFVRDLSFTSRPPDVWQPFVLGARHREWQGRYMGAVARLRDGTTLDQARAEMAGIGAALASEFPQFDTGWTVMLRPLRDARTGGVRQALLVLSGAVACVLLIACANVANLLLARGASRQRELVVRRALGASRLRIAAQLLTETVALALLGGAAGMLVAEWGLDLLVAISPASLTELGPIRVNYTVLAFTAAVSMVTAVVAGLAFAIEGSRADLHGVGVAAWQVGVSQRHRRLRHAFVIGEIALAVVLLVAGGLMLRSFARIRAVDPGFASSNVLTARVALPTHKYSTTEQRLTFFRDAVNRVRALPGVDAAGAVNCVPLSGLCAATSFTIVGRPQPPPGQLPVTEVRVSDEGYFQAMRIALLKGRLFSEQETRQNMHVVVVNETLARQYFSEEDPLGQRLDISMGPPPRRATQIIGVVADVRLSALQTPARPTAYWPHAQLDYPAMTLTVRTASEPAALAPALERIVQSLDQEQPLSDVRTMDQWVERALSPQRFNTVLLMTFAGVAILLAAVGIYGVMSYTVSRLTPEIGLRLALGALQRDIVRMVMTGAIRLSLAGLALGVGLAFLLRATLNRLLYETESTDVVTFAGVIVVLGAVAVLASYLPARRAARTEPVQALRSE